MFTRELTKEQKKSRVCHRTGRKFRLIAIEEEKLPPDADAGMVMARLIEIMGRIAELMDWGNGGRP